MGSPICFTPAPESQVSDSIEESGLPLLETVFDELLVRVGQHELLLEKGRVQRELVHLCSVIDLSSWSRRNLRYRCEC